jgi:hypothetical protein
MILLFGAEDPLYFLSERVVRNARSLLRPIRFMLHFMRREIGERNSHMF